jgi:hypothetical protein
MFQGLCGCEAKFVSRQATLSKALDRRVEETLNFNEDLDALSLTLEKVQ